MYSPLRLAAKYAAFYLKASSAKGHGIHSPFVFDFIKYVKNDRRAYTLYTEIETRRKKLLSNEAEISVDDFGAGSGHVKNRMRKISAIASSSLKPKKFSQLLNRTARRYNSKRILELGTSFGITTSYLAAVSPHIKVDTLEGAPSIAAAAMETFAALGLTNIQLHIGEFEKSLPLLLSEAIFYDLIFIDGNHRKAPTLEYFEILLRSSSADTIMIFDDVHWSAEMEEAWEVIKAHKAVTLSLDLFFIGIVFFRKDFQVKQHFDLRF